MIKNRYTSAITDYKFRWWDLAPGCVAAYQPKGAKNYDDSKINLANPGIYNAVEGVAPYWDSVYGWHATGKQYLDTGISNVDSSWSVILKYSDSPAGKLPGYICGSQMNTGYYGFLVWRNNSVYNHQYFYNANSDFWTPSNSANGVVAISNTDCYYNAVHKGNLTGGTTAKTNFFIFMMGNLTSDKGQGKIQALAIYNQTITPGHIADLTNAMNAL